MTAAHIAAGKDAERTAAAFLQSRGLQVLARNYRSRRGEIDIVAEDGRTLVFVEVRRRKRLTDAAESIDGRKRARLTAAAAQYLADGDSRPCRFDAILVDANNSVRWLRAAFDAAE
ncbi:MAG: YraN family protein [Gammaproteobacteria bacterium]